MTRSTFHFDAYDCAGNRLAHVSRRCSNVAAYKRTRNFLERTTGAVAAFAVEAHGRQVHSAYRR